MISPKDLRAGNAISIPNCGIHATVKIVLPEGVEIYTGDVDLDTDQAHFSQKDIFGINITGDLLLKTGYVKEGFFNSFKKCQSPYSDHFAYALSGDYKKDIIWCANELHRFDGKYYLSISKHIEWPFNQKSICGYLHQLQNIFWFLRGVDLIYKPDFNPNDI